MVEDVVVVGVVDVVGVVSVVGVVVGVAVTVVVTVVVGTVYVVVSQCDAVCTSPVIVCTSVPSTPTVWSGVEAVAVAQDTTVPVSPPAATAMVTPPAIANTIKRKVKTTLRITF